MRFWLDMGVDGFRLDAIPYLVEREGTNNENLRETHAVIKQLRAAIDARYQNRFLLAEANQWPEDVREYFGDGDECHMAYHFPLMPRIYMAIAQEDRYPIIEIMQQTPDIPGELPVGDLPAQSRRADAGDGDQQGTRLHVHDLRGGPAGAHQSRHPPPPRAADGERHGPHQADEQPAAVDAGLADLYYGDEIGMGDNFFIGDRNGVRTPMQWSPDRNAGFSRADPQRLYLPPIMDAVYGYQSTNVEAQSRDPEFAAELDQAHAGGAQDQPGLRPRHAPLPAGPATARFWRTCANSARTRFCASPICRARRSRSSSISRAFKGRVPVEMLGRTAFPPIGELPYLLTISAYGFYWFRLATDAEVPSWHEQIVSIDERPVLVLFDGWTSLFRDRVVPWRIGMAEKTRPQFETDTLPRYIETQRWYAAKGTPIERARIADHVLWQEGKAELAGGAARGRRRRRTQRLLHAAGAGLGGARRGARAQPGDGGDRQNPPAGQCRRDGRCVCGRACSAARWSRRSAARQRDCHAPRASCEFRPTAAFGRLAGPDFGALPVERPRGSSSNTVVTMGERLMLKGYRRLRDGVESGTRDGRCTSPRSRSIRTARRWPGCSSTWPMTADAAAGHAAGLRGQSRRRLDLLARVSAASPGAISHDAGERCGARQCARGVLDADAGAGACAPRNCIARLARPTKDAAFSPQPLARADLDAYRQRARG